MSKGPVEGSFKIITIAGIAMVVFMFITGLFDGKPAYADSSLTVEILSGETPTSSVSASVAPTINASGTYVKSDNVTVKVKTDNDTGYELSLRANDTSHPDRLINSADNSYFESIASATTESSFKNTDLSTITTSGGKQGIWGYLPSKYNSADNSSFLPTPGTAGHSLDKTSTANPTTANNYTLAIGAKISQYATVGTYTNSFAIVAVANPNPYTINYVENTGLVTNMPENVIGATTSSSTVTLSSTTPTRAGYEFKEWNTSADGTGTAYQPGATYTLANGVNLKLYAIWEEKTIANSTTMQEVTSCPASLPTGQVYTIKDSRDNTEYHTAKLADGKCWMLDNLALDLTDSNVKAAMYNTTDTKTNATYTQLGYLFNGGGTSTDQYSTAAVSSTWSNAYDSPMINMGSKDVVPTSCNGADDPMKDAAVAGNWKVGGYYNYCAASAGTYCWTTSAAPTNTQNGVRNIDADICPAGWRMPTSHVSGEYSALANAIYGSAGYTSDATAYANYRTALHLPISGHFASGSVRYTYIGGFWSSTRYDKENMLFLDLGASDPASFRAIINPSDRSYRFYGYSVRCVSK